MSKIIKIRLVISFLVIVSCLTTWPMYKLGKAFIKISKNNFSNKCIIENSRRIHTTSGSKKTDLEKELFNKELPKQVQPKEFSEFVMPLEKELFNKELLKLLQSERFKRLEEEQQRFILELYRIDCLKENPEEKLKLIQERLNKFEFRNSFTGSFVKAMAQLITAAGGISVGLFILGLINYLIFN